MAKGRIERSSLFFWEEIGEEFKGEKDKVKLENSNRSLTPMSVTVTEGGEIPEKRKKLSWVELDREVKGMEVGKVKKFSKPEGVEWKHFINMIVAKGSKYWPGKMRTRKDGEEVLAWREE